MKPYVPIMTLQLKVSEPRKNSKVEFTHISTPSDAEKFFEFLKTEPNEKFVALHLNARHEVIGLHEVSHGTLSASLVHPREVFKAALLANSYGLILAHNHPSGSRISASQDDLDTTEQLLAGAKILGLNILDHLILGPLSSAFSIRENHPELWSE